VPNPGKTDVRIVVEGGGNQTSFRNGFQEFFKFLREPLDGKPVDLSIVQGGSGESAANKFAKQRELFPDALIFLLVDSEFPVSDGIGIWDFLVRKRRGFEKPRWASDNHAYLMVQCIETWIISDIRAHPERYGPGLKVSKISRRRNLEEEPKADVQKQLKDALGSYGHSEAPKFIAGVDPEELRKLPHGARLIDNLVKTIRNFASTDQS
jgi:hypothetical protein